MKDFNSALYQIIGDRIKKKRSQIPFSQEQLAKKAQISRTSISNIEIGRHQAPLHVLYKISVALEYEIQSLLPTFQEIKVQEKKNKKSKVYGLEQDLKQILLNESDLSYKVKKDLENYIKKLGNDSKVH